MIISLEGLDKADVLAALYNASRPQGMGMLHYDPTPMTRDEASKLLNDNPRGYFDYIKGRVMKVNLSGPELDPRLYDRDNGTGAAKLAISTLRKRKTPDNPEARAVHREGTSRAIQEGRESLGDKTTIEHQGDMLLINLGTDDVAKKLRPALDEASRKLESSESSEGD